MAFVGIGSNRGSRVRNYCQALALLDQQRGTRLVAVSNLFLAQPVGVSRQRWFINGVAGVETTLSAQKFFSLLQEIEEKLGRTRPYPGAPRTIDLDLLFFNGLIWLGERLRIPHPEIWRRRFVLAPLAEIAADFHDPVTKLTVKELLASCPDKSRLRLALPSARLRAVLSGEESSLRQEVY